MKSIVASINSIARSYALQNAVKYGGKANLGAVIGKLIAGDESLKERMKDVAKEAAGIVAAVNKMTPAAQLKELQDTAPELLEDKPKDETKHLPPLKGAVEGKVVTAFPPEPSGVAHIGHASGALFNLEYAKMYKGKFIIRFEDTNPELAQKEFYAAIEDGLRWLGITWEQPKGKTILLSDTIPAMYRAAEKLITTGHLYACSCDVETMRSKRESGDECEHRNRPARESLVLWKDMLAGAHDKGDVVVRFNGDMAHKNTVMRDPTMFRVIKKEHCIQGNKFIVWPSYDFAAAFSDGDEGITHRVRSKEFELRAELQRALQQLMGFNETIMVEQARINIEGVPASKRTIRELIAKGEMRGWDDPRLTTLTALRRRGFLPEGIRNFLFSVGITKSERTLPWASLEAENRKVLDPIANRYSFIANPVEIEIAGAPSQDCHLPLHPQHPERGQRTLASGTRFLLSTNDVDALKQRELYRLMDCLNFKKTSKGYEFVSKSVDDYREKGKRIMNWLPNDPAQLVDVEILMPDATTTKGVGEQSIASLPEGTHVQFERFGFCRLDKKKKDKNNKDENNKDIVEFWFTHK